MRSLVAPRAIAVGGDRLTLSGELDIATASQLDMRLESLDGDILIDCEGLTFIDASGLRPLLSAHRRCTDRDTRLILINPPLCLTRLLMLAGLGAVFHVQTGDPPPAVRHGRMKSGESATAEDRIPTREQGRGVHTSGRAGIRRRMSPLADHTSKEVGESP